MRVAFYENGAADGFGPIALTRPVFELVCGQFPLRERVLRRLDAGGWGAFLRDYLAETYRETHPESHVNDPHWLAEGPTLLINGRWLPTLDALARLQSLPEDEAGIIGETLVYLTLDPLEAPLLSVAEPGGPSASSAGWQTRWDDVLGRLARSRRLVPAAGRLVEHPWNLVEQNAAQLVEDFRLRRFGPSAEPGPQVAVLGPLDQVHLDPSAVIEPFVVIDARRGPVSIEAGAAVQACTRLEGPCHVGRDSQLFRAQVRGGTTIGPVCRVGGEVEASILHGYVNKYHDGFLGHSYVCPWVNFGAQTTNSDLKSDYSPVRVPLDGAPLDTGLTKVGCFFGDHTKTAIGSLFNTGSSIGVMCLVLPTGELLPRHIPSFASVWHGELTTNGWNLDRALATARAAMHRRNQHLTPAHERLYRSLFERTRANRERVTDRLRRPVPTPL